MQRSTAVLGPGDRAAVWVQGCELRCHGCLAAETHPRGGTPYAVEALVDWLVAAGGDGVTFSGGEPMLQAAALTRVVDLLRTRRPGLSVMVYTGYRLEWLRRSGAPAQRALLERADLLVDGPYVERRHAPLRWRGSRNQRLIDLSGLHAGQLTPDVSAGLELELDEQLGLLVTGVPPLPHLRDWLAGVTSADETAASGS
ncbi:radical SAM protein [Solirubrobacter sp. CPCC 204708]|nr:radical SAM protein [Solirubrobacter deserti]